MTTNTTLRIIQSMGLTTKWIATNTNMTVAIMAAMVAMDETVATEETEETAKTDASNMSRDAEALPATTDVPDTGVIPDVPVKLVPKEKWVLPVKPVPKEKWVLLDPQEKSDLPASKVLLDQQDRYTRSLLLSSTWTEISTKYSYQKRMSYSIMQI